VTRAEVRSEIGDLLAARNPEPNGGDQWLAAHGPTTTQGDARESICIAWFRASHPGEAAVHSTQGNPTGATGPHAIAARPPLEATRPIDEGDDGFTSGCAASTGRFNRLDTASAPRGPSEQARHPASRRQTQPRHHLYLNSEQS